MANWGNGYKSVVQDLGWANGWGETPDIIKKCREAKHKTEEMTPRMFDHVVRCDICGYVYKYDSSG